MIGYVTLGTNDLDRATEFYDQLMPLLGGQQMFKTDRLVFWGKDPRKPMLAVGKPYNDEPATVGNGVMIALSTASQETVQEVHKKALELGAQDEGEPGLRTDNFYGAYFRDPDGNKLVVFTMV